MRRQDRLGAGFGWSSQAEQVEAEDFFVHLMGARRRAAAGREDWSEEFPRGRFVAPTGTAGPEGRAAAAALLDASAARLESGELVRRVILPIDDHWASHVLDVGRVARGWLAERRTSSGELRPHPAVDISAPRGTPVHAVRSGIVEHSGMNGTPARGSYGEVILIRHPDGSTSFYAHLDRRLAARGQLVEGGEVIAEVGNTSCAGVAPSVEAQRGTAADPRTRGYFHPDGRPRRLGPHLHLSIHGVTLPSGVGGGPLAGSGVLPAVGARRTAVAALGGADVVYMATSRGRASAGARVANEFDWGVDPVAYLGHATVGVRLFARPR